MLKKEITFIYTDKAEYQQLYPIYLEAEERGYKVRMSNDILEKNEIGIYCQHLCYPKNSNLSIIMLHDIGQRHGEWPNIWLHEPWNNFDIGILPSKEWEERWFVSSNYTVANPKKGVLTLGWPRLDRIKEKTFNLEMEKLKKKIDLKKKTILYAPSWENDDKQDEFIRSAVKFDLNILIKQAWYDPKVFPKRIEDIKRMYRLHNGLKNVYILPSETNIFDAISIADILVSDESSTMFEAMLLGIPSIAVTDWKIPDTYPSRLAIVPYNFVKKTLKKDLEKTIMESLENLKFLKKEIIDYREKNFTNLGRASIEIVNLIDSLVENNTEINYIRGKEEKKKITLFNNEIYRKASLIRFKYYLKKKYFSKNIFLQKVYLLLKKYYKKLYF